jgi:hypothetical protein
MTAPGRTLDVTAMLDTYPDTMNVDKQLLAAAISEALNCFQVCTACADACLSEKDKLADLTKCIRTNLDCADACEHLVRVLSRHTDYDANITRTALQACITACKTCGDECTHHAEHMGMEHCRICAAACRACEQACQQLLDSIA